MSAAINQTFFLPNLNFLSTEFSGIKPGERAIEFDKAAAKRCCHAAGFFTIFPKHTCLVIRVFAALRACFGLRKAHGTAHKHIVRGLSYFLLYTLIFLPLKIKPTHGECESAREKSTKTQFCFALVRGAASQAASSQASRP